MTDQTRELLRVLLPTKPKHDLGDAVRVIAPLLPPRQTDARCLYVHRPVETDFFIPESYGRSAEIARLEFDAEAATRVELELEMQPLAARGYRVSADVIRGAPTEEILREASLWRADLVAVRTRSLAAHDHRIGGMASALLYHATCPVLTHHAVAPGYRVRRILIPTDFSEASRRAVDWGLALARLTQAEPVLLHVVARWNRRHGIDQDELLALATEELEKWRARIEESSRQPVRPARVITASSPAEGILSFARDEGCGLIVLSATGSSAMRAILVGANTRKVVRASLIPTFVLPASNRVSVESVLARAAEASRWEPAGAIR